MVQNTPAVEIALRSISSANENRLARCALTTPNPVSTALHTPLLASRYKIKRAYGISSTGFSGKLWSVPIQGVGQGNGTGPQIWALVSTPILNMLRHEGCGAAFSTAITNDQVRFVGYTFFDDTDLVSSGTLDSTAEEVAQLMQTSVDSWEGGIRASGGALVPEKSFWYLVDFKWTAGKWKYRDTWNHPPVLVIRDPQGNRVLLRLLRSSEAEKTLGVFLTPDGNNTSEIDYLPRTATGHLPRRLAWESMSTTILKTLTYPFRQQLSPKPTADISWPRDQALIVRNRATHAECHCVWTSGSTGLGYPRLVCHPSHRTPVPYERPIAPPTLPETLSSNPTKIL